jgi:hypothetical protein
MIVALKTCRGQKQSIFCCKALGKRKMFYNIDNSSETSSYVLFVTKHFLGFGSALNARSVKTSSFATIASNQEVTTTIHSNNSGNHTMVNMNLF